MLRNRHWVLLAMMIAAVAFSACAKVTETAAAKPESAKIEPIGSTELSRLTLKPKAADRIGITTEKVAGLSSVGGKSPRSTVPYEAVLYDAKGATWVYTNPEPLVFVRHSITVEHIKGDLAFLLEGPPVGTLVVTAGGAELTGVEFGVGK